MTKLSKTAGGFSLPLSDREIKELELIPEKEYEILKARKGLYVLMDKHLIEEEFLTKLDDKIFALLEKSAIQDRVEEKFEKMLNELELNRFNELLKQGKVEKFKASEKYKKAVYKISEIEEKKSAEKPAQSISQFSKGKLFITVRTEQQARELNDKYGKELKDGQLKGIKEFDNSYYLIDTDLLSEKKSKLIKLLQDCKSASAEDLAVKLSVQPDLVKGVCAFLKEDGEIMEKKRGIYNYIP
ncbi:MAG: hypothetical protein Q7R70_00435 [Candidatus Diapherotrites archaeon]|nr:hypothetical protein [Candidatus Diapherotrites archaeon]